MDPSESSLHDIPITAEEKSDETNMTTTEATETPPEEGKEIEAEAMPELENPELEIGDHVYQWRDLMGVPYVFQHHGIVMDIIKDEEGKPIKLTIADFSNVEIKGPSKGEPVIESKELCEDENETTAVEVTEDGTIIDPSQNEETERIDNTTSQERSSLLFSSRKVVSEKLDLEQEGLMRTYTDTDQWHKVHYESGFWQRQFNRSGTVTSAKSDPVGLVLARVNFITQHPDKLPEYHVVHANCECVAFWCKTGQWATLQASSFLELTAAGQVKQSATLAATAAGTTATVTVPKAGILGSWFGMTTTSTVPWLSIHPLAIPGLACYAAVTIGVPAVMYATAHKKWKETTEKLTEEFWNAANENPEVFAECLTHWSDKA